MDMERVKTICPWCFKIFDVPENNTEVHCCICGHTYDLPRLMPRYEESD